MLSRIALSPRTLVSTAAVARPMVARAFSSVAASCPPGAMSGPVCFEDDIAHVQVNNGYSKKYADGWERIFGKSKSRGAKQATKK
ncbi:hypothetical protein FOZ63_016736 [Perkinsus olseni]|uniref:Uncharacterized protein n=1 Tax=Perkinsus olseni TaxID=32597 RepID=A0A7J6SLM0_PEROL|nr:hypothetical protein FOZ63_016736 [Perkinsus olseni]